MFNEDTSMIIYGYDEQLVSVNLEDRTLVSLRFMSSVISRKIFQFFFFWIPGHPGIEHDWSKPFIFHGGYRGLCWTRIHYLPPRPEDGGSLHVSYICFQYFWRSIIVFPDVSGCIIKAHDSGICTRQQNMVLSMRSSQVISWKKHDAPQGRRMRGTRGGGAAISWSPFFSVSQSA